MKKFLLERSRKMSFLRALFLWAPLLGVFMRVYGHPWRDVIALLGAYWLAALVTLGCVVTAEKIRAALLRTATKPPLAFRIITIIVALLLAMIAAGFALIAVTRPPFFPEHVNVEVNFEIIWVGVIAAAFALIQIFNNLRVEKKAAELRAAEAENKMLRAQLSSLTAQMNPHLLFNALNTIASLAQSNPKAAEETTLQLAELYRRVLDATKRDTHSLREELAICRAYLAIEKARFGDRLAFVIDADVEATLPVLSLQPLVENAVKHGIAPLPEGGTVTIRAFSENGVVKISVEDTGKGPGAPKAESTALSNLTQRLRLLYNELAQFSLQARQGGGTIANLTVPA